MATPSPPVLEVRELVKVFGDFTAVGGVTLAVPEGRCFGLLGPNGAGKTTTVEIMEGLSRPSAGQVLYRGGPLGRGFHQRAGIQFQTTALQDYLTTREHLALFARLYRQTLSQAELVELCHLGPFLDRDARRLSGGQRQRLLLAIALVNDPDVVFLDEPTTGLDPQARRNFWALVQGIRARGKTILLTTHYMEEAYELCDEIAIMDHGRIIAQGSPQELLAQHFDEVILELPREAVPAGSLAGLSANILEKPASIEFPVTDVGAVVADLATRGVDLKRLKVRPPTLEDLFLELTGRELRQ